MALREQQWICSLMENIILRRKNNFTTKIRRFTPSIQKKQEKDDIMGIVQKMKCKK